MKDLYLSLLHTAWTEEEKKQLDEAIDFVENYGGLNFLPDACALIYKVLGVDYIILGVLEKLPQTTVHSVVFLLRGHLVKNTSYPLVGTPCENVIGKEHVYYPSGIQKLFPEDKLLEEMQVESYLGIPLFDRNNNGVGVLALLHHTIIERGGFVEALINVLLPQIEDELAVFFSTPLNKQQFLANMAALAN